MHFIRYKQVLYDLFHRYLCLENEFNVCYRISLDFQVKIIFSGCKLLVF